LLSSRQIILYWKKVWCGLLLIEEMDSFNSDNIFWNSGRNSYISELWEIEKAWGAFAIIHIWQMVKVKIDRVSTCQIKTNCPDCCMIKFIILRRRNISFSWKNTKTLISRLLLDWQRSSTFPEFLLSFKKEKKNRLNSNVNRNC